MDERDYKRRIEAKRRIIPQSELEKRNDMNARTTSSARTTSNGRTASNTKNQYGLFAGTVLSLAIIIVVYSLFLVFYVQQVEVTGNEYSSSGDIIEWIEQDITSVNSIAMCVKYNYLDAQLPPQVEEINISIVNPWTLSIESIDKEPVAGLAIEEGYIYCDLEGIVILETQEQESELPLIEGIEVEEYTLYSVVPIEDIEIFRNALEVTSILNLQEIEFEGISCSSGAGVNVTIGNITVKLGEDKYQEKILQLSPILEEIGDKEGTLNLENYSSSNTSITFTQKNTEN